jgi:aminoglycoside phosphotransferase (APT) family kinase protein
MKKLLPSSMDYISAVENAMVLDPVLRNGEFRRSRDGELLFYSGGFTMVFVVDSGAKTYALRCWSVDIGDAETRYNVISEYLGRMSLRYFTDFAYVPEGILVNGVSYPFLRMKWVEGPSLREFIGEYRHQPQVLKSAAEKFLAMAETLHKCEIAHGDLQNDNVKVHMSQPEFVLIDYDSLFVQGFHTLISLPSACPASSTQNARLWRHPKTITLLSS